MATKSDRPFGATVLVVLEVIGGILGVGGGIFLLGISEILRFRIRLEVLLFALGLVFVIVGTIQLFLAYGLWNGRSWAWTWAFVMAIIGLILAIISAARGHLWSIVRLIADILVVYYLNTSHVKAFFHKDSSVTSQTPD